jgi:hypothetical protein
MLIRDSVNFRRAFIASKLTEPTAVNKILHAIIPTLIQSSSRHFSAPKNKSDCNSKKAHISGVPTFIVNGQFRITGAR